MARKFYLLHYIVIICNYIFSKLEISKKKAKEKYPIKQDYRILFSLFKYQNDSKKKLANN